MAARPSARPSARRRLLAAPGGLVCLTLVLGLVIGTAGPSGAAPATAGERRIATKLKARVTTAALGSNTSGILLDAASGRTIWSRRSKVGLMPASAAKLATALTAMEVLGPEYRVRTRVRRLPGGSRLYLVGGGDPLLTGDQLRALARRSAKTLLAEGRTRVSLRLDDSLYPAPTPSTGWKASYYPHDVSPVRPLVVDQRESWDTALDAARMFGRVLERRGLTVVSVRRQVRPKGTEVMASQVSSRVRTWLSRMLLASDNDIAEGVLRLSALRSGRPASWNGARAARNAVLAEHGITGVDLVDGSGLSRKDRVTARGLGTLIRVLHDDPALDDVIDWLPVSGVSGTLLQVYGRFDREPASCAVGLIRAKTGTLGDAVALAGVATTRGGRERVFVLLENGRPSGTSVRRAIDRLAATMTGCY